MKSNSDIQGPLDQRCGWYGNQFAFLNLAQAGIGKRPRTSPPPYRLPKHVSEFYPKQVWDNKLNLAIDER